MFSCTSGGSTSQLLQEQSIKVHDRVQQANIAQHRVLHVKWNKTEIYNYPSLWSLLHCVHVDIACMHNKSLFSCAANPLFWMPDIASRLNLCKQYLAEPPGLNNPIKTL